MTVVIDMSVLDENLNDSVAYKDYFRALGYEETDTVFLRTFSDKKDPKDSAKKLSAEAWTIESIMPTLHTLNSQDNGVFYVVNGFGQQDSDVKEAKALFIDFDDFDFPEQLRRLNDFPLKPSIIIKTRKSLHCYWILRKGERDIRGWRDMQNRLITHFESDDIIENPSRVMRLYGFEHRKEEPVTVTLLWFHPELTYAQSDFDAELPPLTAEQRIKIAERWMNMERKRREKTGEFTVSGSAPAQDLIRKGHRHQYVIQRLGYYVGKLFDSMTPEEIVRHAYTDFQQHCENPEEYNIEHFLRKYLSDARKWVEVKQHRPKDFYKVALRVWERKNPDKEFPAEPTTADWMDVEMAYFQAEQDGTLEEIQSAPRRKRTGSGLVLPESTQTTVEVETELNLVLTEKHTVKSVFNNYVEILSRDPYFAGKIRFNLLTGRAEIQDVSWDMKSHPVRDFDLANIRNVVAKKYGIENADCIAQGIALIAQQNCYNPVADLIRSFKWDGKPRLAELFPRYLGAERSGYTTEVTRLLFNGIIQRTLNPGAKFDYCLILADSKQGTGKSTMCRLLALKDEWFCDCLGDLSNHADAYEMMSGHTVIELAEMLATRRAKDIEAIKAFITRTTDTYRTPYGRYAEDYPRRCVFVGTSNRSQFLPMDTTGNRRFLPLLCDGNRAEMHPYDDVEEARDYVRQCYAEALAIGQRDGFDLVLDRKYLHEAELLQQDSSPEDSLIGQIQEWLDVDAKENGIDIVCSRMLYDAILREGRTGEPASHELSHIAEIMNQTISGWRKYSGKDGTSKTNKYRFKIEREKDEHGNPIAEAVKRNNTLRELGICTPYGSQRAWERVPEEVELVQEEEDDGFQMGAPDDIVRFFDTPALCPRYRKPDTKAGHKTGGRTQKPVMFACTGSV